VADAAAPSRGPADPLGRALHRLSAAFALFGGLVLVAIMLLSVASIAGRTALRRPIPGDFELVQVGCAVAVFAFLPWCQLRGGNIIVDFFTVRAPPLVRAGLDAVNALLLGAIFALIAWRMTFAAVELHSYNESTMVLRLPVWIGFVPAVLSCALLAVVSAYTAWRRLRET
jgi:TRAP-type C4-dicarboxylate transport system permease small subunit